MEKELGPSGTGTGRNRSHQLDPLVGYCLLLPMLPLVGRMNTPALLTDGLSRAVPYQRGVHTQLTAICVCQGPPQPMEKELRSFGTGTGISRRHKFEPWGGYRLLLPMLHLVGRMKTIALPRRRRRRRCGPPVGRPRGTSPWCPPALHGLESDREGGFTPNPSG